MSFEKVLDQGYVRLVNHMGSDLTIANAARVSYAKESVELTERDIKLIRGSGEALPAGDPSVCESSSILK